MKARCLDASTDSSKISMNNLKESYKVCNFEVNVYDNEFKEVVVFEGTPEYELDDSALEDLLYKLVPDFDDVVIKEDPIKALDRQLKHLRELDEITLEFLREKLYDEDCPISFPYYLNEAKYYYDEYKNNDDTYCKKLFENNTTRIEEILAELQEDFNELHFKSDHADIQADIKKCGREFKKFKMEIKLA